MPHAQNAPLNSLSIIVDSTKGYIMEAILIIGGIFVFLYFVCTADSRKTKNIQDNMDNIARFNDSKLNEVLVLSKANNYIKYCCSYGAIALDPVLNKLFLLLISQNGKNEIVQIDLSSIVNAELNINGDTVVTPSIGGAIIGGVLLGGVGAVVGASMASVDKGVKNVALIIHTNDLITPIYKVVFLNYKHDLHTGSRWVQTALEESNKWYSRILTIIDKKRIVSQSNNNIINEYTTY